MTKFPYSEAQIEAIVKAPKYIKREPGTSTPVYLEGEEEQTYKLHLTLYRNGTSFFLDNQKIRGINWHLNYHNPDCKSVSGWHGHYYRSDEHRHKWTRPIKEDVGRIGVLKFSLRRWHISFKGQLTDLLPGVADRRKK